MPNLTQDEKMPGIADAFLRDGRLYEPLLEYITEAMNGDSEVTKAQREISARSSPPAFPNLMDVNSA